jgi:DNA-binding MarR family transcriptional regulator
VSSQAFVLTNSGLPAYLGGMTVDQAVRVVQVAFPQVYLACHTRHQRKRSTEHRLSSRDATILAHLHETRPIAPARLAAHLGIGRSTMSEALKRLTALGFVTRPSARGASVVLSARGSAAVSDTSVLESARLRAVLASVTPRRRAVICRGLQQLADACRDRGDRATQS